MVQGYCVKCKKNGREMKGAKQHKMSNGRPYIKGTCAVCGSGMSKIGTL